MTLSQRDMDEAIYVDLSEGYQAFSSAVGKLNKANYGLVQAGRCWKTTLTADLREKV